MSCADFILLCHTVDFLLCLSPVDLEILEGGAYDSSIVLPLVPASVVGAK